MINGFHGQQVATACLYSYVYCSVGSFYPYVLVVLFGVGVKIMEQPKIVVDIQSLSKSMKKKNLLLQLHYQLTGGKILALCGGNGAGKSTLIRLITGLMKPTKGHVLINGLHRKKHQQHFTKQFGYMPDDFLFQQKMTTKETIHFYAQMKQIDKTRYEEVLQEVGLHEKMNELVGNFSKGMKQRLLLAQALLATPDILILDEPTNGLDPYWVKRFSDLKIGRASCRERGEISQVDAM